MVIGHSSCISAARTAKVHVVLLLGWLMLAPAYLVGIGFIHVMLSSEQ